MRIEFASRAEDDLVALYLDGLERFGREQAELYSQSFTAAFETLARFPLAGGIADGIRPPTRHLIHNAYAMFYEVRGDSILVLRVIHGRMLPDDNL